MTPLVFQKEEQCLCSLQILANCCNHLFHKNWSEQPTRTVKDGQAVFQLCLSWSARQWRHWVSAPQTPLSTVVRESTLRAEPSKAVKAGKPDNWGDPDEGTSESCADLAATAEVTRKLRTYRCLNHGACVRAEALLLDETSGWLTNQKVG